MTSLKTCSSSRLTLFCFILCLGCGLPVDPGLAGTVKKSYVDYDGGEYHLNLVMHIDAPTTSVWQQLTDFNQLGKVNPAIKQSTILHKNNSTTRIKVISEGCVLFFCRTITQVQDVRELGQGYLVIAEVAGKSDFSSGHTLWHVTPQQDSTRVTIRARLKPDFWLPPLLGPWLFQKKLVQQAKTIIINLEQ
ncbi:MAG: SRPBCC family protein [Thioalkalispiraceae bacterium]|jgi:hypothetical protein